MEQVSDAVSSEPSAVPVRGGATRRLRQWGAVSIVLAVIWAIARSGARIPAPGSVVLPEPWPFPSLAERSSYLRSSPISFWISDGLGLTSQTSVIVLRFVLAVVAVAAIGAWTWRALPESPQRARGVRLVVLGPLLYVLLVTLGLYDAPTVIGFALVLGAWVRSSRVLLILAGVFLGIQHFEQAVIGLAALCLGAFALRSALPSRLAQAITPAWAFIGIAIGKVLLTGWLIALGVSGSSGRASWLSDPGVLRTAVVGSLNFLPALIVSLFAGLWGVVLVSWYLPKQHRERLALVAALLVLVVPAILTLDHTRVFVISSAPLVALIIVVVIRTLSQRDSNIALKVLEGLAWVIVPINIWGTERALIDGQNVIDQWRMLLG